jgi:epoxyqueuosine reductase
MSLSQDIKRKAIELGFDLVGVTGASPIDAEQAAVFAEWLKSGFAGQMSYMHRNLEKRLDPAKLLDNAQSVIVVGLNYVLPAQTPKSCDVSVPAGRIARYARYEDYHPFIKDRLRRLADFISSLSLGTPNLKICVDSAPVAERVLALRAGLGFIGRNHMLINPQLGCEIFLAEIITDLKIEPDEPIAACCGDCARCIEACPTGALRPDGQFDARRCINYLTIEHKGAIPQELAEKIGDRLFGCDECVLACPFQKDARPGANKQLRFYPDKAAINLADILSLTAESFEAKFADSPIRRVALADLKRNAAICLANAAHQS